MGTGCRGSETNQVPIQRAGGVVPGLTWSQGTREEARRFGLCFGSKAGRTC